MILKNAFHFGDLTGASRSRNDKCVFLLYIEANSISYTKGQKVKNYEHVINQHVCMEFSLKDLYAVQEIQAEENLFKLVVKYVVGINVLACK